MAVGIYSALVGFSCSRQIAVNGRNWCLLMQIARQRPLFFRQMKSIYYVSTANCLGKQISTMWWFVCRNCWQLYVGFLILLVLCLRVCLHASITSIFIFLPRANEVCEGYVFTRVCRSVHKGGGTWAGTPPGRYATPRQVHPLGRYPPGRYPPGRYTPTWAGTPLGRSACWEIRATSGRYASYWNAFLLA